MYPKALLPMADRKKSLKLSYCQRLARHLDRFDENPGAWLPELRTPPCHFLSLPLELRQDILYNVLEDDEMGIPRPNSTTRDLTLVCKDFARDIKEVSGLWDRRVTFLRKLHGHEHNAMSALIKDMMSPLEIAAAALSNQNNVRSSRAARRGQGLQISLRAAPTDTVRRRKLKMQTKNVAKRLTSSNFPRFHSAGKAVTTEEIFDRRTWQRARVLVQGQTKSKLIIPRMQTRAGVLVSSVAESPHETKFQETKTAGRKKRAKDQVQQEGDYDWTGPHPVTSPGEERERMLKAYMGHVRNAS